MRASDKRIWDAAIEFGLAVVTKDSDFDTLAFVLAPPGKVIRIGLGNCTTASVTTLFLNESDRITQFLADSNETLLIIP